MPDRRALPAGMTPRLLTQAETAAYLGRSEAWLREHLGDLFASGFPAANAAVGRYDKAAVDRWLDRQSGLALDDDPDLRKAAETAALDARTDTWPGS